MSAAITTAPAGPRPGLPWRSSLAVFLLMLLAAAAAWMLTPRAPPAPSGADALPRLEVAVPTVIGEWQLVPSLQEQVDLAVDGDGERLISQPYDQTLLRTYQNARGEQILLAVAYTRQQSQEIKVHRPEVCYTAVGFEVLSLDPARLDVAAAGTPPVDGMRMVARSVHHTEAVSYWIRMGSIYSQNAVDTRLHLLAEGLQGRLRDGALVRASRVIADPAEAQAAYPQVEGFLAEFAAALTPEARALLLL
ncbi:exosortase C-terminal domain/associated protein EpsI [Methylibium sp.]|uniref:exosortase C-terminal domain/associated protein EpsI n=1 Tax=Methylibium sp. TaxID=2067992 RepID=UPI003BA95A7D